MFRPLKYCSSLKVYWNKTETLPVCSSNTPKPSFIFIFLKNKKYIVGEEFKQRARIKFNKFSNV